MSKFANNMTVENATLVKIGKYKHICELRDEGLLYMNNLPYFWQMEDEDLRGDKFDSVIQILRGNFGIVTPKSEPDNHFSITNWEIGEHPLQPDKINVFCMVAVRPSFSTFPVDNRNYQFGDHALVLAKPQEFIDRISKQLIFQNISHASNLVEYVSDNYQGQVGPFKKRMKFNYQTEWRLVCKNGPGKELKIRIGSIKDICIVINFNELNHVLSELLNVPLS